MQIRTRVCAYGDVSAHTWCVCAYPKYISLINAFNNSYISLSVDACRCGQQIKHVMDIHVTMGLRWGYDGRAEGGAEGGGRSADVVNINNSCVKFK